MPPGPPRAWPGAPPGPPPVYGALGGRPAIKHLPWFGAPIAGIGLILYLLSVTSLSWVDTGTDETFDMGHLADFAEQVNDAPYDEDLLWVELYGTWGWIVGLIVVTVGVLFSALLVPTDKTARTVIFCILYGLWCFPFGAFVGLLNLADEKGTVAPRILGALLISFPLGAHLLTWVNLVAWDGSGVTGDDMGPAVWVGSLGLVLAMIGCGVGTRTVPDHSQQLPRYG